MDKPVELIRNLQDGNAFLDKWVDKFRFESAVLNEAEGKGWYLEYVSQPFKFIIKIDELGKVLALINTLANCNKKTGVLLLLEKAPISDNVRQYYSGYIKAR